LGQLLKVPELADGVEADAQLAWFCGGGMKRGSGLPIGDRSRSFDRHAMSGLKAEIGQDGHDRGQKVIASAFADVGFDVDIGPLFATAEEAARQAVENDVHILGVSSLAAAHLTAVPELKAALKKQGRDDIMIIIGGVVPPQDYDALYKAGAEAIFPPGTVISDAAEELIHKLNARLGHSEAAE
jgi:methylmalonyl-CoA mutase